MADKSLLSRLASAFSPGQQKSLTSVVPANKVAPRPRLAGAKSVLSGPVTTFYPHEFMNLGLSSYGLAFAAYWYVATRWRAQKLSEAPVMVVEENQDTGSEEWLSDHELAAPLENPSPDFDMGELIEQTSHFLDNGGVALWVMDKDRVGRIARLTSFCKDEFVVKPGEDRLYYNFRVTTAKGPEDFTAEDVVYFRDHYSGGRRDGCKSRMDVAMSWLRLGESARQTIRDLLSNAVWPSGVAIPDKEWNPGPEELEMYKAELESYAQPGQKGRPFAMLGGGSFEILSARIRDLVPSEVLNRVESVVASVSGVPAIVLQFQVGMENSPWSQMEQARKMGYEDCIVPQWRKMERVMTRQMLRPVDEDLSHFIRFDRSKIPSLQIDRQAAATTASLLSRIASLNERRDMVGLEPSDDPAAEEIPELRPPPIPLVTPPAPGKPGETPKPPTAAEEAAKGLLSHKARVAPLFSALRHEAQEVWKATTHRLLTKDADEIADIVGAFLTEAVHKSVESKARGKERVITAVVGYLKDHAKPAWAKATTPLLLQAASRSTAVVAADLGISYNLLHPKLVSFAQKETGAMIRSVSDTTLQIVNDVVSQGLQKGDSTATIAKAVRESAAFTQDRAKLIARTETTASFNGAPAEALQALARDTDRKFKKTWSGALDDRERDEHVALEGETVDIDQPFSNGRMYPDEPNCRCAAIFSEVEA